ncbi:hypothetical protein SDC9_200291 [bioreactor metagenome]|uniref:Uncharacterized protein n=1 Tax=bioreactor metagenome TaxID=1076179 RepID=A0A645IQL5_9ZZZZ
MFLKEVVDKNDLENGTQALELAILYGRIDLESM